MEEEGVIENGAARGAQLAAGIEQLRAEHEGLTRARGLGLLRAFDVPEGTAKAIQEECLKRGLIVIALGTDGVRLAPPLIVSEAEVEEALGVMQAALRKGAL